MNDKYKITLGLLVGMGLGMAFCDFFPTVKSRLTQERIEKLQAEIQELKIEKQIYLYQNTCWKFETSPVIYKVIKYLPTNDYKHNIKVQMIDKYRDINDNSVYLWVDVFMLVEDLVDKANPITCPKSR